MCLQVVNALQANSQAIAVRFNVSQGLIQVVDNGKGMSKEELKKIGKNSSNREDGLSKLCKKFSTVYVTSKSFNTNHTFLKVRKNFTFIFINLI